MQVTNVDGYFLPPAPEPKNDYMDQRMFMRLLVAQLTTQNPLEPMNERDFFAQLAQIGTVQGIDRLGTSMQMAQAAGFIGRTVDVRPAEGGLAIRGVVETVEIDRGKVFVTIQGHRFPMDNIVRVIA
jgi:flagellar basal-body rod modification protein FlgD